MSTEHTLITEPDASSLAARSAGFVADRIRAAVAADGTFTCAVSGGQTPWLMLAELARQDLPWSSVEIYQVDERVAADGDPVRNLTHLRQILGSRPVTLVPMPVTGPDLEAATAAYASRLPARFDLVHLGLGADGHTASLVPDAGRRAERYAAVKQEHLVKLIEAGDFTAFPDAIRFVLAVKAAGIPIAAASSSKNADLPLRQVSLDTYVAEKGLTLLDLLDADVSGRDLPRGKPDPMIFLVAAEELPATPARCFVVEDAAVGVRAAKAGGMAALAVARLGDEQALADAGADLVVRTLDEVSRPALAQGRLARKTEG